MKIIRVVCDTKKKSRWVLAAAQWGKGRDEETTHENPNWRIPPSGKPLQVQFSVSNEEIRANSTIPECRMSHHVGADGKFLPAKFHLAISISSGKIEAGEWQEPFVQALQRAMDEGIEAGEVIPEPTVNNLS